MKIKTWQERQKAAPDRSRMAASYYMELEIEELRFELENALFTARYESDLAQQALEDLDKLRSEIKT